jgi:hypothetical protein
MKNCRSRSRFLRTAVPLLALLLPAAPAAGAELSVRDTVAPTKPREKLGDLRRGPKTAGAGARIEGDAIVENARIRLILRRTDGRVSIAPLVAPEGRERVEVTAAVGGDLAAKFTALTVDPAVLGEVSVTAEGATEEGKTFRLHCRVMGDPPIAEFGAADGATALSLSYRSGHAVLPEILGDDLVLRPSAAEGAPALVLPADHAVLHPVDRGDAILLASWPPAAKDVAVHAGKDDGRPAFVRTDIPCAATERIWISLLSGKSIWHETDAAKFAISEYRKVDWRPAFPARYRCDLRRDDPWGLTDSWKRQPVRDKFWMAFLGNGFPPLCIDAGGPVLRLPRFRPGLHLPKNLPPEIKFAGPVLIYPFERETDPAAGKKTPEWEWTVLDVIRATLGEGWIGALDIGEGVLAVEPFPPGFVFMATCGATGFAEECFTKGDEKASAEAIRTAFDDMNKFVRYHRERIEAFVAAAAAWRGSLEEARKSRPASPEYEKALEDLLPLLQFFPDLLEESRDAIKTPEHCKGLTEKAVALIAGEESDRLAKLKELGVAMRTIGGRQDDMLCGYRMAVKAIRQRAGQIHAASADPWVRERMRDLRASCRSILRICSPYEEHLFLSASSLVEKQ